MKNQIDLKAPRMFPANAKKANDTNVEEKKNANATNETKGTNVTNATKSNESEKIEKKDAKPQSLTQGIVATDIFKPTRSNADTLREVDLDLKVDLKAPRMEPKTFAQLSKDDEKDSEDEKNTTVCTNYKSKVDG
jgi:hypothetical protein